MDTRRNIKFASSVITDLPEVAVLLWLFCEIASNAWVYTQAICSLGLPSQTLQKGLSRWQKTSAAAPVLSLVTLQGKKR
jgi:hypothetical protein